MQFILASASPRRRALLRLLTLPYKVQTADVDEDSIDHPDPVSNVVQRAELKAQGIWPTLATESLILAADTTVALGQTMLNKPANDGDARIMLRVLRGRWHNVHTGMVLRHYPTGRVWTQCTSTAVHMRYYTEAEIDAYISTGDPLDKAGAYAIQHRSFHPVDQLQGCYLNVVGLSICALWSALSKLDIVPSPHRQAIYQAHQGYPCPLFMKWLIPNASDE